MYVCLWSVFFICFLQSLKLEKNWGYILLGLELLYYTDSINSDTTTACGKTGALNFELTYFPPIHYSCRKRTSLLFSKAGFSYPHFIARALLHHSRPYESSSDLSLQSAETTSPVPLWTTPAPLPSFEFLFSFLVPGFFFIYRAWLYINLFFKI